MVFDKSTGPRPGRKLLGIAGRLAREGAGDHMAVAMSLRSRGVTQAEIVSVLGAPHRNKLRQLEKSGLVRKYVLPDAGRSTRIRLVVKLVTAWIAEERLWPHMGRLISYREHNKLDDLILAVLMEDDPSTEMFSSSRVLMLNWHLEEGKLNVDWLFGPNGLALLKAKAIKKGLMHAEER
ncbi:hypothetical protein GP486_008646 [Trichoglossum hirsutum]|uniref:Uncharacterized protein n=1 Tax=Trichoglossum hirsutum TaxID=265104 RepID=A0A9P8I345_9PEZI|nr:hypothetical protein GP486_008646 [Trichoglossum hirsutum]